jgi:nitrogen regulatory protein P-II 1
LKVAESRLLQIWVHFVTFFTYAMPMRKLECNSVAKNTEIMNKIEAIIQPDQLTAVKDALVEAGIEGMTVTVVRGFGRQKGQYVSFRGAKYAVEFLSKLRIETIVPAEMTDQIVSLIARTARTGAIGDGKVFVSPITEVVRIRTGERGLKAISISASGQVAVP